MFFDHYNERTNKTQSGDSYPSIVNWIVLENTFCLCLEKPISVSLEFSITSKRIQSALCSNPLPTVSSNTQWNSWTWSIEIQYFVHCTYCPVWTCKCRVRVWFFSSHYHIDISAKKAFKAVMSNLWLASNGWWFFRGLAVDSLWLFDG